MRIGVYIPDSLGEQLAQLKDRINVSAVCQEALQREMTLMTITNDNSVTARLRQSRLRNEGEEQSQGTEAGAQWAAEFAEWADLQAIEEATSSGGPFHVDVTDMNITREDKRGRDYEVRDLDPDDPWCRGFVAGAMRVLDEHRDAVMQPGSIEE